MSDSILFRRLPIDHLGVGNILDKGRLRLVRVGRNLLRLVLRISGCLLVFLVLKMMMMRWAHLLFHQYHSL
jgi:hypothetical protein